ncbi:multidrug transporter [Enterovibrio norvegicus]|uniref:HlyD family secretion protein n=1 Tax=Enterovibrio norvegicus TaxID=188144 RepID=A0ABV4L4I0_9GAMM|nr:biotin/lipoyl-binding protein [Enterovibrio norvegicus]OEE65493.1 multidrug transporter [Enterovibrio norvegicus]OEF50938.1 multidrug transporter [Enterovibrio norvegicus]OEF55803.1 multidrug transporter [Enterovibrio norvegicus]
MLEGLAVWALFIYLLRMVGMPWNLYSKLFAYIGGGAWLLFVWIGLLNYTPMDLSGGSVVQSPHIQLRPGSSQVRGNVDEIFVSPNEEVKKGQLVYSIEDEPYQIALNRAIVAENSAQVALDVSKQDVTLTEQQYQATKADLNVLESQLSAAKEDAKWKESQLNRYVEQNRKAPNTVATSVLDEQRNKVQLAKSQVSTLETQIVKAEIGVEHARLSQEKSVLAVAAKRAELDNAVEAVSQAQWNLEQTQIIAPADGYVTNFIMREGQYVGVLPRLHMYTDEKYVLMRVNHQAIRNVKVGQYAEFASPVYPGKIFKAEVEGIVEATGESQGKLLALEEGVRVTTGANLKNKHHFVRLKLDEPEGYDIPVGAVGLAWISGEKPIAFMSFLDVVRGIIIRMKAQLYFVHSV